MFWAFFEKVFSGAIKIIFEHEFLKKALSINDMYPLYWTNQ